MQSVQRCEHCRNHVYTDVLQSIKIGEGVAQRIVNIIFHSHENGEKRVLFEEYGELFPEGSLNHHEIYSIQKEGDYLKFERWNCDENLMFQNDLEMNFLKKIHIVFQKHKDLDEEKVESMRVLEWTRADSCEIIAPAPHLKEKQKCHCAIL